jgi:hypothetical protein
MDYSGVALWPVVSHALVYGGVLSLVLSILLIALLWFNAEIMLGDYPPDIRAMHGPMSGRSKRQKPIAAILVGAPALAVVALSFSAVRAHDGGGISFQTAFVHLFLMFQVFNVIDLLLLDFSLVAFVPRFFVLPGTEGAAGYKSYWFHCRGFLIGIVLILVVSLVMAAAIASLV